MAATHRKPSTARRESRIIERPRLIRLLDRTDSRIILLVAPAGYGKTTLARQWARTLTSVIWLSATPAHGDVAEFAEDLAAGIDALGGDAGSFVRQYIKGQANPQRAAQLIGRALAERVRAANVQWLVIDDYHQVDDTPEIAELVRAIHDRSDVRLLVAARDRPRWASARRSLYGEITEVTRDELAMTAEETAALLPRRPDLVSIASQARGWPAVLALAAATTRPTSSGALPSTLHRYLAEELFQSASEPLRADLLALALLPALSDELLRGAFGRRVTEVVEDAQRLGFLTGDAPVELHPLLREFLLDKVAAEDDAEARVRAAVERALDAEHWDAALELVLRFDLRDLVEPTIERSFKPLVRGGRIGTLSSFARRIPVAAGFPPAVVELVEAEVALREGRSDLALELSGRAAAKLGRSHQLYSRARTISGHAEVLLAGPGRAEVAFAAARETALDDADETEALLGIAAIRVFDEQPGAEEALAELAQRRHRSPTDLVRCVTADLSRRHFADEGFRLPLGLEEAAHELPRVEDPRARTGFAVMAAAALGHRAEYDTATEWVKLLQQDMRAFELEFVEPYADWMAAFVDLGLRRFGAAERALHAVEDLVEQTHDERHRVNAGSLRARLLLATGRPERALVVVHPSPEAPVDRSWLGEYVATRALALACLDRADEALEAAETAIGISRAGLVRGLAEAARAVVTLRHSDDGDGALRLIRLAESLEIWDPVVCAVRASLPLADALAANDEARPHLERLYRRSRDYALARRAGFRTRSSRDPAQLLSPRELEVLGLIAQGRRNREIADALFISESTTKVHVRHVLEKLGVRTRAEAVARFDAFQDAEEAAKAAVSPGSALSSDCGSSWNAGPRPSR